MFIFEKRTQIPVRITNKNPKLAGIILSQYGGPDGELSASLRYLSQRFTMPDNMGIGLLTDIGTEELAHLEIVGSIVSQLTSGEGAKSFDRYGVGDYYVDHGNAVYPQSAAGSPFTAAYLQSKGDPIADLTEDLAAEQKARATYDNILRLSDDPDVNSVIKFLRAREVVHFQRFGDTILTKLKVIIMNKKRCWYGFEPQAVLFVIDIKICPFGSRLGKWILQINFQHIKYFVNP